MSTYSDYYGKYVLCMYLARTHRIELCFYDKEVPLVVAC
jgi:hypothetical protein